MGGKKNVKKRKAADADEKTHEVIVKKRKKFPKVTKQHVSSEKESSVIKPKAKTKKLAKLVQKKGMDSSNDLDSEPPPRAKPGAKPGNTDKKSKDSSDEDSIDALVPQAKTMVKAADGKKDVASDDGSDSESDEGSDWEEDLLNSDSDDGAKVDPKKHEVCIKGLPYAIDEETLRNDFSECGNILRLDLPMADGRSRGVAFITFADQSGVDAALKYSDTEYSGRYVNVLVRGDRPPKGKGKGGKGSKNDKVDKNNSGKGGRGSKNGKVDKNNSGKDQRTVYVYGLPYKVDLETLRKHFQECGEIKSYRPLLNKDGTTKGVVFVEYKSKESVKKAVEYDRTQYGGHRMRVVCCRRDSV